MDDAIQMFYKLKGSYQKEIDKKKYKIMHTEGLSMSEKRDLFMSQKFKCIGCKKPVNTIFSNDGNRLKAICGATETGESPCNLNIDIVKGETMLIGNYTNELQSKHKELVKSIMEIKYNLLFSHSTEDEAIAQFDKTKNEYDSVAPLYNTFHSKLLTITELLNKQEEINLTNLQIFEVINEIKSMVVDGIEQGDVQYFRDSVELYIHKLLDILTKNQNLKYSYQAIEKGDNDTYQLVQKPYTIPDLEITVGGEGKVESLVLGKNK